MDTGGWAPLLAEQAERARQLQLNGARAQSSGSFTINDQCMGGMPLLEKQLRFTLKVSYYYKINRDESPTLVRACANVSSQTRVFMLQEVVASKFQARARPICLNLEVTIHRKIAKGPRQKAETYLELKCSAFP